MINAYTPIPQDGWVQRAKEINKSLVQELKDKNKKLKKEIEEKMKKNNQSTTNKNEAVVHVTEVNYPPLDWGNPIIRPEFTLTAIPINPGSMRVLLDNLYRGSGYKMSFSFEDGTGYFKAERHGIAPTKIIHNGPATIVFWNDDTKTIVKQSENDIYDPYAAFCSALAKRIFGTNSHLKSVLKKITVEKKSKEKAKKEEKKVDSETFIYPVLESRFFYEGFNCYILMQPHGHRCGYVELPKTNKYFGKGYDDIPVECHGGLTYAEDSLCFDGMILNGQRWFIGFDCAHFNDEPDLDTAVEYFKGTRAEEMLRMQMSFAQFGEVRTEKYVRDELMNLVDQLIKKEDEE